MLPPYSPALRGVGSRLHLFVSSICNRQGTNDHGAICQGARECWIAGGSPKLSCVEVHRGSGPRTAAACPCMDGCCFIPMMLKDVQRRDEVTFVLTRACTSSRSCTIRSQQLAVSGRGEQDWLWRCAAIRRQFSAQAC